MPFISKDWRSPGELWVKTDEGWERKKVLEHGKLLKQQESEKNESAAVQPYCHITIKCTREIAGFNELDEVVKKLDFRSAVRDVRRFNYICALLDLLVGQQMTALSGCTQKVLLAMLEEVANYATANQHNPRALRRLLTKLRALSNAEQSACWGGPLGSKMLWNQHSLTIKRIQNNASNFKIIEPLPGSRPQFLQLPEECIREVVLRLSDHKDLISASEVCDELTAIVNEKRVWRELTRFHFTPHQIDTIKAKLNKSEWKDVYHALKRNYGVSEERQYAEMLSLCRYCCCLFWKSSGHPCIADQSPEFRARIEEAGRVSPPSPVPPSAFLKFFSL
ncbi:PREDICTED: F-box only protein 25 [Nicrophorus vespilloides]|uniref:F-box only protein 25 n=1 Tax=Nicrophorus vespilloides TaxID=110193 RepID=A0ABM1MSL3_NICVS|nr:PREDICTED: F-box only protein 25 [Nicrophorus vespilloides]